MPNVNRKVIYVKSYSSFVKAVLETDSVTNSTLAVFVKTGQENYNDNDNKVHGGIKLIVDASKCQECVVSTDAEIRCLAISEILDNFFLENSSPSSNCNYNTHVIAIYRLSNLFFNDNIGTPDIRSVSETIASVVDKASKLNCDLIIGELNPFSLDNSIPIIETKFNISLKDVYSRWLTL